MGVPVTPRSPSTCQAGPSAPTLSVAIVLSCAAPLLLSRSAPSVAHAPPVVVAASPGSPDRLAESPLSEPDPAHADRIKPASAPTSASDWTRRRTQFPPRLPTAGDV